MPYQIVFMRWNRGEPDRFPSQPVREALARFGIEEYGSPTCVDLPGGLSLDLYTGSLNVDEAQDIMLEFRGISKSLFELIYEVGRCVPLVAMAADQPMLTLIFNEQDKEHLPESLVSEHPSILCHGPDDVANAIVPAFRQWSIWAQVE
jgi:hypothetical protein